MSGMEPTDAMKDLADFLAARYDEAEAAEQWLARWPDKDGLFVGYEDQGGVSTFRSYAPDRTIRDITLKRAILADVARICEVSNDLGSFRLAVRTMRQLGTEFDQHPEYRAGWAP